MAIKATIKDGVISLPKGVLRRAHLPENGECQVEVGDHIIELRPLPEQYPSWELPEEKRIEWAYQRYKEVFPNREPNRRLLRLVGLGPRSTPEEQREELYRLMNERYQQKRASR